MVSFEREEKFGTCKQKFRNPLGFIGDSHWSKQDNLFVLTCTNVSWFLTIVMPLSFSQCDSININQCVNVTSIPPNQTIFGKWFDFKGFKCICMLFLFISWMESCTCIWSNNGG
jgi:hypothetical protein